MDTSEGFKFVSRRKRGKRISNTVSRDEGAKSTEESEFDIDKYSRRLSEAQTELETSEYVDEVFQALVKCERLLNTHGIEEILCYGLGHFSDHVSSRYQLALLLEIRKRYNISKVCLYDPLFFPSEVQFLESLGCRVLLNNEEGKRRVETTTLVYLPHCPKQLTNNFLYANWSGMLKNCILLSNSFKRILESHTSAVLKNTANFIVRINPFVEEIELNNSFRCNSIFNDCSLHVFTEQNLNEVSEIFWKDREEPEYRTEDLEFITNSVAQNLKL